MTASRTMVMDTLADDGDNDGEQVGSASRGCLVFLFPFFWAVHVSLIAFVAHEV
jgi:hypothetical protein